jgi:Spy/CpxP family protein refolding chaperone
VNRFMLSVAVCGLFLAASVADAQQQPGRRPGGQGGPGFGGGFGGQTQGPLDLVGRESVQKDLALKEDQVAKVNEMSGQIRDERRAAFGQGNFGDFQNLSQEERQKRFQEMQTKAAESRKKTDEKFLPMLAEILTEEQDKRLDQIVLQVAGVPALLEADLQKKLGLSKDQTDKLASVNKEYTDKRTELMPQGFGGGGRPPGGGQGNQGNFQETFTKLTELRETRDKDMLAVLNADQKAKYDEAKGKAFDVASVQGFGGRGPGGGGPGGAGGRPGGGQGRPGANPGEGRPRPANNNQ